ncbi:MAG: hypothetical protein J6578_07030 [Snodgrassella sp.]|uniref:hypothetical protein n=1 Tax=Snodgrassella TaxID=1193515 RepID=UPI002587C18A|nr:MULTISPECIES: hypothetical protein [Snodgrassella]MCO6508529.1 hypothetical protein [Snodgrassella sp.]MCO6513214.1 hypothetical protein [Snodgrassella sp.]MCO6516310.1 hypothetical protein [Snodgrassella sp.]MCO6518800.1 hypothetical protein [Snodgrassella sp.]WMY92755.1 hypothetical protein PYG29_05230 [Snodgrassella communis]
MTQPAKNSTTVIIGLLLFIIAVPSIIGLVLWQNSRTDAQSTLSNCNVRSGCILPGGAVIQFTPPADITKPFDISMRQVPASVKRISIHFTMRNMDLGFNRTDFKPQGQGVWTAHHAVLPVCIDERNDFLGDLTLDDQHYIIVFSAP